MADFHDFTTRAFACRIGGNGAEGEHRAGYNGVWSLVPAGGRESLFVPSLAGLNLEHYFDGFHNGRREIFFEPRVAPMEVERPDGRSVRLVQRETPFWGVESVSTFTVREPNAIDLQFRCTPRRPVFNAATMGVFWASYINRPEDNAIHFVGRREGGPPAAAGRERLRYASPRHGDASSIRGRADLLRLDVANHMTDKLFSTVAPVRWDRPYYYGRWRDHVYLVMFKSPELLRFAMSPSGGGQGNPAWDFQILVPDVRMAREYRLEVRCVFDRWQGDAWVDAQAAEWLGS